MNKIFRPSSSIDEELPDVFYKAESDGVNGNCMFYEEYCPTSLLNTISIFANIPN